MHDGICGIFLPSDAYDVMEVGWALFKIMEKIEGVSVIPCVDSKFVQPFRIKYKQARFIHTAYQPFHLLLFPVNSTEWKATALGLHQDPRQVNIIM